MSVAWTRVVELHERLRVRWDRGTFLKAYASGAAWEPVRLKVDGPTANDFLERLDEVQRWVAQFHRDSHTRTGEPRVAVEMRTVKSRALGANEVPGRIRFDSFARLCAFLGVADDVRTFDLVRRRTHDVVAELDAWVAQHPIEAIAHRGEWDQLLAVVRWIVDHDTSELDVRHLDVAGVDTKFVERHRKLLAKLLAAVRTEPAEPAVSGGAVRGVAGRLGFRERPTYTRFRLMQPVPTLPSVLTELEVRTDELARLQMPVRTVFVVENKASYLAFPEVESAIVIFGEGFHATSLEALTWLHDKEVVYWGDIDTHGFAILDRLRARLPRVRSILMDRDTLITHRTQFVVEPTPTVATLAHLTDAERSLYRDLVEDRYGPSTRLEQERIRFSLVRRALAPWLPRTTPDS